jgi:hypothetical protein
MDYCLWWTRSTRKLYIRGHNKRTHGVIRGQLLAFPDSLGALGTTSSGAHDASTSSSAINMLASNTRAKTSGTRVTRWCCTAPRMHRLVLLKHRSCGAPADRVLTFKSLKSRGRCCGVGVPKVLSEIWRCCWCPDAPGWRRPLCGDTTTAITFHEDNKHRLVG